MRKYFGFLLLSIVMTTVALNSNLDSYAKNKCKEFTNEEIKKNIRQYINAVFGEKNPTLQDLINFEGNEAIIENEEPFEEEECKRRGWTVESSECVRFKKDRFKNANNAPSYYYNFLRRFMKLEEMTLVIHEIHHSGQKEEEIKTVLVNAAIGKTNLQFYHAGDTCSVPLGLVSLSKINDKLISDILKEK